MQLRFVRVLVDDQDRALAFYTERMGFVKKADMMMGNHRFLTVAAPGGIEGVQLILEPTDFPPSAVYQRKRYRAGIPSLSINTEDIGCDYALLKRRSVSFIEEPADLGAIVCATLDDTCGNLVYLVQAKPRPASD